MANAIELKMGADASALRTGLDAARKQIARFRTAVSSQLGQLIAFGSVALTIKTITEAASNLGETQSKVGVIFGDSAREIEKWAKTSASALGQSSEQAMNAASTFATFGKSAGLSGQGLVAFSTSLVSLSADLASFYNRSPEEAIMAIGAALRGESEPIRSFGVLLDDASMRNEALRMGLIATTKDALNPQQKVLAAQALILKQTSDAQGDFARTSGGLANQQRILDANVKNTSATLGQALLPAFTSLARVANEILAPIVSFTIAMIKTVGIVNPVSASLVLLRVQLSNLESAWLRLKNLDFSGAFEVMKNGALDAAGAIKKEVDAIWSATQGPSGESGSGPRGIAPDGTAGGGAFSGAATELEKRIPLTQRLAEIEEEAARKKLSIEEQITKLKADQAALIAKQRSSSDMGEVKKLDDEIVSNQKEINSLRERAEKESADAAKKQEEEIAALVEKNIQEAADLKEKKARDAAKAEERAANIADEKKRAEFDERQKSIGFASGIDGASIQAGLSGVNYSVINAEAQKSIQLQEEMAAHLRSIDQKNWTVQLPEAE